MQSERQTAILQALKENKSANVADLAKKLYVSEATIRRDLAQMESMGLIERTHGGALLRGFVRGLHRPARCGAVYGQYLHPQKRVRTADGDLRPRKRAVCHG